ncbi:MBL fold metallo-hydrolase [Roseiflexus castenholzii]|uniref:Beta-lactamase domain protein n=1 Tax=Roseiflexus castenholzii (strain DSM 13941 / HLO8) TaxID=383372 RepID=A7NND3_ROSCS|nr:MBL fold metallo-hydrolase [Roseiflexus castenholzii]ABU59066.1 beta-lactamase domain protein [Roseiflexus castenholzii DSM 13941]
MPLLQSITTHTAYIPGANNLGIILTGDGGAIAVDTGLDKDTGRMLRRALEEAGLRLRAIISTHHHADHIGGNDYLVRNLPDVAVYAPRLEAPFIENPLLEPIYLALGASPPAALRTKWLMAKGVPVDHLIDSNEVDIAGVTLEIIALSGHSLGQIGVAFDGVCFAADGFFGPDVLAKHGIPYAHDVAAQIASLERLAARGERFFLPGHGELTLRSDLEATLRANRDAVERALSAVGDALAEPGDTFAVARRVQKALGLTIAGLPQYAIFVSAVAAHLAYLEIHGDATLSVTDQGAVWRNTS